MEAHLVEDRLEPLALDGELDLAPLIVICARHVLDMHSLAWAELKVVLEIVEVVCAQERAALLEERTLVGLQLDVLES